jgi:arylsulfatase A-like enzyme
MASSVKPPLSGSAFRILVISLWFGVVAGFGEGLGLWLMQVFHVSTWKMQQISAPVQMIWAGPVCYGILFLCMGGVFAALQRLIPRIRWTIPWTAIVVFVFATGLFVALLSVSGRLTPLGILGLSAGLASAVLRYYLKHAEEVAVFWRRSLPWLVAATLLALVGIEAGIGIAERRVLAALPPAKPGAPNIVVLVVDTLRADRLSWYGYSRQTSPHMDQVGREGVTFDSAVATSSWTLPTHASMLTGLAPHVHGAVRSEFRHLSTNLAEALLARGYRTEAAAANLMWITRAHGFGPGFVRFDDGFYSVLDVWMHTLYGRTLVRAVREHLLHGAPMPRRSAANVFRAALNWIGERQERPFFVFLNVMEPHSPYDPPPPWNNKFSKVKNPRVINIYPGAGGQPANLTPAELEGSRDAYDGTVAFVDDQIGDLLAELKNRGLEENTIVILTADHGESLGDHGLQFHTNALYWELVHVPLILRWPGHLPAGKRIATTISMVSLPATILELICDGQQNLFPTPSLAPLWREEKPRTDWPVALAELAMFHYAAPSYVPSYHGAMKSLVNWHWQFIVHEKFGPQLFDRTNDPHELHDLAATPEGQRVVADFTKTLQDLGAGFPPASQATKNLSEFVE